jgi:hypothetical protein
MIKLKFITLAIITVIISCSIPPVRKVQLLEPESFWYNGNNYAKIERDSIKLLMAWDCQDNNNLSFNTLIYNESKNSILVDPAVAFNILIPDSAKNSLPATVKTAAYDPETKLKQLNSDLLKENSEFSKQQLSNVGVSILDFVATVTSKGKTDNSSNDSLFETQEKSHNETMGRINEQQTFWTNAVIRKTTLLPGSFLQGKIVFPGSNMPGKLSVTIPVGKDSITVSFRQTFEKIQ